MDKTRLDAISKRQSNWMSAERGSIGERVWGKTLIGEDIPALLAEIERLTADRDAWRRRAEAAERDFVAYMTRNIKGTKGPYACDLCRHGNPDNPGTTCLKGCDGLNKWEWRGPEEDKP